MDETLMRILLIGLLLCTIVIVINADGQMGTYPWSAYQWRDFTNPYDAWNTQRVTPTYWRYVYVDNSSNATELIDYQVKLVLGTSNFGFSHCNSEGSNIIFTRNTDTLDYWLRSDLDFSSDTAEIWIEIDTIPASDTAWVKINYGHNRLTPDTTNGVNTFLEFNDWDSTFIACGWTDITDFDSIFDYGSNPVIDTTIGAWDEFIREMGNVLYDTELPDSMKYMAFYTGYTGTYQSGADTLCIGMAYSSDAESWTKYAGNPVFGTADGDTAAEDPHVVKVNDTTWYMYYEIREDVTFCCTGLAISYDTCKSFTAYVGNPILEPSGEGDWEDDDVSSPVVWIEGSTWYMLYEGRNGATGKIGLAISADGLAWAKDINNPVLDVGAKDEWDDESVASDDIEKIGATYYLFYHGYDGSTMRVGMATATSLTSWTRYGENPLRSGVTDALMVFSDADGDYNFHYDAYNQDIRLGYPYKFDTTGWRAKFPDWALHQKGSTEGRVYAEDGELVLAGESGAISSANIVSDSTYSNDIAICVRRKTIDYTTYLYMNTTLGKGNVVDEDGNTTNWHQTTLDSGYVCWGRKTNEFWLREMPGNTTPGNANFDPGGVGVTDTFAIHEFVYDAGANLKYYINYTLKDSCSDNTLLSSEKNVLISQGRHSAGGFGGVGYVDWVFVRKYSYPEPSISISSENEKYRYKTARIQ